MASGRRGGWRPRQFSDAALYVTNGRWGPKRLHVEQCCATIRAEDLYDDLVKRGLSTGRGSTFTATVALPDGRMHTVRSELVQNPIWRIGRLFVRCGWCGRRATRLYVPCRGFDLRCRRCWGLSYESQAQNYGATGYLGWLFGTLASEATLERRREARRRSRLRQAARKEALQKLRGVSV